MRIKALKTFFMRGVGKYSKGKQYDVTDSFGKVMLKRGLVERVKEKKEMKKAQENKQEINEVDEKKEKQPKK